MSESVSKEQIEAWFNSGPIKKEMLSLWLEIINGSKK